MKLNAKRVATWLAIIALGFFIVNSSINFYNEHKPVSEPAEASLLI